ncbi:tryptophan halogenase family protein [Caulobacter sp. RL271]|jgi:tryptophan halogenase|uniref:Tryptophan 7-halogenase n=1 Tax=Caulobacter segnis TaxID=88688 RepID=A0ABY4ZSA6_9CAUL|nr:tryptophan halogenase family protein [Caulobacter segnis]USQ94872.1 tryptophan 7-halogenase [Caulobacter segnis]
MTQNHRLRRVVIVGGGTAGWMTAAALGRFLKDGYTKVTLVESEAIGTVGVGESTIPQINIFNRMLGLDENEFVRKTKATFKLGIDFVDWKAIGHGYHHPFGPYGVDMEGVSFHAYWLKARAMGLTDDLGDYSLQTVASRQSKFMRPNGQANSPLGQIAYAFQFDAGLYARFLREYAEARGVTRQEGKIASVQQDGESGHVTSVTLESGQVIEGDLFIDCSGFRALLIEQTLKAGYEDWSKWLLNDRAVAMPCTLGGSLAPVTRATARPHGWQWRIPLQHRLGNGYAYSSAHVSDDEALADLMGNLDGQPLADPNFLRFTAGRRKKSWDRNVVAIGLSAGFMEPLESQSIHLIQVGISRLLAHFPDRRFFQADIDRYNRTMTFEYEKIRDFLILHFKATTRSDTPYWDYLREMPIPDYLADKIDLFRGSGRVFRENEELFNDTSWFAVFIGQGIVPESWDPMADAMDEGLFRARMAEIKAVIARSAQAMPGHMDFIAENCAAE